MQDIKKTCADNLCAFSKKYDVKLKPSHAHELVAAFFGFKSNSALKNDPRYTIGNLYKAKIIILAPTAFVDLRREDLKDLPSNMPNSDKLGEIIIDTLISDSRFTNNVWSYEQIKWHVSILTHDYQRQPEFKKIFPASFSEDIKVEISHEGIRLVLTPYKGVPKANPPFHTPSNKHYLDVSTTVWLQRISGHIGYAEPEISIQI